MERGLKQAELEGKRKTEEVQAVKNNVDGDVVHLRLTIRATSGTPSFSREIFLPLTVMLRELTS